MKKFILVLIALMMFSGTALAAPKEMVFYLNTAANDLSAVTGAPVGGVSRMVAEGMGYDRNKNLQVVSIRDLSSGRAVAKISGVSTSQAAAVRGGSNSGSTFFLYASVSQDVADINNVAKIAIFGGDTPLSGDTVTPRTFVLPAGNYLAFFWGAGNGTTLFSGATVQVRLDIPNEKWPESTAVHLGTRTYLMTSTTGTSFFSVADSYGEAIPEGARYAIIHAESGGSVWVTRRTAVDRDRDPGLAAGDVFPIEGSFGDLKRIGVAAAATTNVVKAVVDFFTRKPF